MPSIKLFAQLSTFLKEEEMLSIFKLLIEVFNGKFFIAKFSLILIADLFS